MVIPRRRPRSNLKNRRGRVLASQPETRPLCPAYHQEHFLLRCERYIQNSAAERKQFVMNQKLCFNCLGKHLSSECQSKKSCLVCLARHHTTLHDACVKSKSVSTMLNAGLSREKEELPLLAATRIQIRNRFGEVCSAKALLDPGSEVSFVTESLAQ